MNCNNKKNMKSKINMAKRVRENQNRFVTIISVNMKREKKKHWSEDGRHVNGRPFKLNLVLRWEDYTRLQAVIIHCVEFYSRKLNEISKKSYAKGSFNLNSLKEKKKKTKKISERRAKTLLFRRRRRKKLSFSMRTIEMLGALWCAQSKTSKHTNTRRIQKLKNAKMMCGPVTLISINNATFGCANIAEIVFEHE